MPEQPQLRRQSRGETTALSQPSRSPFDQEGTAFTIRALLAAPHA